MIRIFNARRGLSPIFATLILIAIAVIAGIVVYMFTSGTIGNLTQNTQAGQEKIAIQTIAQNGTAQISLFAMSQSGGPIALDSAIVKDGQGNTVEIVKFPAGTSVLATLTEIDIPVTATNYNSGSAYSVQLVSVASGNFPSTSFKWTGATP